MKRRIACLLVLLLAPIACRAEEPPVPPVATAEIEDGWQCQVKDADGYRLDVDACVGVGSETFVVYEDFQRQLVVAAGPMTGEPATAVLRPVQVVATSGGWHSFYYAITIGRGEKEQVLAFFPPGQPSIFGEPLVLENEVPARAKKLVPKDGEVGYYGTVAGQTFLVYSTPLPQEPPKDDIEAMMRRFYPPITGEMHILLGSGLDLAEEKVLKTYSYGGGREIYIETEKGTFLFSRVLDRPLFGTFIDRYYVPER